MLICISGKLDWLSWVFILTDTDGGMLELTKVVYRLVSFKTGVMVWSLTSQTPIHAAPVYEVTGFQQLGSTPLPMTLTHYVWWEDREQKWGTGPLQLRQGTYPCDMEYCSLFSVSILNQPVATMQELRTPEELKQGGVRRLLLRSGIGKPSLLSIALGYPSLVPRLRFISCWSKATVPVVVYKTESYLSFLQLCTQYNLPHAPLSFLLLSYFVVTLRKRPMKILCCASLHLVNCKIIIIKILKDLKVFLREFKYRTLFI